MVAMWDKTCCQCCSIWGWKSFERNPYRIAKDVAFEEPKMLQQPGQSITKHQRLTEISFNPVPSTGNDHISHQTGKRTRRHRLKKYLNKKGWQLLLLTTQEFFSFSLDPEARVYSKLHGVPKKLSTGVFRSQKKNCWDAPQVQYPADQLGSNHPHTLRRGSPGNREICKTRGSKATPKPTDSIVAVHPTVDGWNLARKPVDNVFT